jgi:hypothetical protein
MSNNAIVDEEAVADREDARRRNNRRTSIQFIDKDLIRRRSSGNEKTSPIQRRLSSINSTCESGSVDVDYLQQYSENLYFYEK